MTTKIALYLNPKVDSKTRERFFEAVEKIDEALAAWMVRKTGGIGAVEKWDVQSSVVWISVNEAQPTHVVTCKSIAKLLLERHGVGDKYEIVVNPHPY